MAKIKVTVNDDAPEDLALGDVSLKAGSTVEIDHTHLTALKDYVTIAEEKNGIPPATTAKTAAAKKSGRKR